MSRYFTRKKQIKSSLYVEDDLWDDDISLVPHLTVDSHDAVDTGLLTASGDFIMRAPNPMGFGKDDEW